LHLLVLRSLLLLFEVHRGTRAHTNAEGRKEKRREGAEGQEKKEREEEQEKRRQKEQALRQQGRERGKKKNVCECKSRMEERERVTCKYIFVPILLSVQFSGLVEKSNEKGDREMERKPEWRAATSRFCAGIHTTQAHPHAGGNNERESGQERGIVLL